MGYEGDLGWGVSGTRGGCGDVLLGGIWGTGGLLRGFGVGVYEGDLGWGDVWGTRDGTHCWEVFGVWGV